MDVVYDARVSQTKLLFSSTTYHRTAQSGWAPHPTQPAPSVEAANTIRDTLYLQISSDVLANGARWWVGSVVLTEKKICLHVTNVNEPRILGKRVHERGSVDGCPRYE